jgi:PAS domain S-box-containing protein
MRPVVPDSGRGSSWAAGALWVFAVALAIWFAADWRESETVRVLSGWSPVPADGIVLVTIAVMLYRNVAFGLRRIGWWLLFASTAVDLVANIVSARISPASSPFYIALSNWLYLPTCPLFTGALALYFLSCGGSFRRRQLWLDASTIALSVLATIWVSLFDLPFAPNAGVTVGVPLLLLYTFTTSVSTTMAVVLLIQITDWRSERSALCLIAAAIASVGADIAWLMQETAGASSIYAIEGVGDGIFSVADIIWCALIIGAVAAEYRRSPITDAEHTHGVNSYSMLPALALLLAIALLVGSEAAGRGLNSEILIGIVLLGAVFLVVRQRGVRRELQRLNRTLAAREAEARLTELVRCSHDLIAVVDARLQLGFVSPAAESMLGARAADLTNTAAARLLGSANEPGMAAFLDDLIARPGASAEMETGFATCTGDVRVIRVIGSNQFANPLIEGISLTLSDVSEQRALERELLDIAIRERIRLCGDIHEGLGQELTGIALLLHTVSSHPLQNERSHRKALREIVGYVNGAIDTARKLALGLSPVHTVRDSLRTALQRLAADTSERLPVRVEFETASDDPSIDDGAADHLYRVAQESISNALRHSGCTVINIGLHTSEAGITLAITDNGCGFDPLPDHRQSLGLRMMEYRARVVRGRLRIEPPPEGGTRVAITVPLGKLAAMHSSAPSLHS